MVVESIAQERSDTSAAPEVAVRRFASDITTDARHRVREAGRSKDVDLVARLDTVHQYLLADDRAGVAPRDAL